MHEDHTQRPVIFNAQHIGKTYTMGEVEVVALHDVSLTINSGELLVILGASGSGKSTLLNILGGLDVPTTGTVSYRGQDLTNADDKALTLFRRKAVGFVFQFYNIIPSLTALENVKLVTDIADDPMDPREALELVGLGDRMSHFPAQMSGGEQQRVAIARAVAKRPDVLLCDEPTGALDFTTGILVLDVIEKVHRELDATVALITHNAGIADMADRVIKMRSGEIVEELRPTVRKMPKDLSW
ncbi:MAG TPA: ABC transporter ATP-binding protein [Candidatus Didemnitutus sp.]|nr:ABC transporter ATP-binding protein [Candidatus Didemnitutus sp.]